MVSEMMKRGGNYVHFTSIVFIVMLVWDRVPSGQCSVFEIYLAEDVGCFPVRQNDVRNSAMRFRTQ
jgi:hypothetical protein